MNSGDFNSTFNPSLTNNGVTMLAFLSIPYKPAVNRGTLGFASALGGALHLCAVVFIRVVASPA